MPSHFTAPTTYFLQEGKINLLECLKVAFQAAGQHNIKKVVIFTAVGEGVRLALEKFCSLDEYREIRLVAVTFPQGMNFTDEKGPIEVDVSEENQRLFKENDIPLVRAHLPFDPIPPVFSDRGPLAQDLSLVGNALSMFCGSMALCVQAIVLACDAKVVGLGEHVVSMTSDTAILAQAATTRRMLRELVIREVLCKPAILTIGRNERTAELDESEEKSALRGDVAQQQVLSEGTREEDAK